MVKALAQPDGGFSGPKAEEASGPCDGGLTIQMRRRHTRHRGEGLRGPKAREAPVPMRREGSTIERRGRLPHQRGMGLNGPNVKEAPARMQQGPQ